MTRMLNRISLATLLFVLPWAVGCHKAPVAQDETKKDAPVTVTLGKAEAHDLDTTIDVVGTLKGWEEVQVGAKRAGHVARTVHDVGDRVAPGETLIELDPVDINLVLRQAERRLEAEMSRLGLKEPPQADFDVRQCPQIQQAEVALERAKEQLRRETKLKERNVTTEEAFQNAEFDVREKQAMLDNAILAARTTLSTIAAAQVDVEVARQSLADMAIRAPQPSVAPEGLTESLSYAMTKRVAAEGQMIQPGEIVAHLVIEDPLRAWASVPERYAPYVKDGQTVSLHVTSYPDRKFEGKVRWVNPAVEESTRTFTVEIAVPNPQRELRSGNFCKIAIIVDHGAQTVVPAESIVRFAGVTKLFVVRDGKAVEVPVETGRLHNDWIQVTGAVQPGDSVVTSGQTRLADGVAVVERALPDAPEKPASAPAEPAVDQPAQTAGAPERTQPASPDA